MNGCSVSQEGMQSVGEQWLLFLTSWPRALDVGMADTATSEHPDAFHTSTESPATGGEQEPQDDLTRILVLLNTMRATVRFHHVRARVASRVGARAS